MDYVVYLEEIIEKIKTLQVMTKSEKEINILNGILTLLQQIPKYEVIELVSTITVDTDVLTDADRARQINGALNLEVGRNIRKNSVVENKENQDDNTTSISVKSLLI